MLPLAVPRFVYHQLNSLSATVLVSPQVNYIRDPVDVSHGRPTTT
jgi:hypothetical protein